MFLLSFLPLNVVTVSCTVMNREETPLPLPCITENSTLRSRPVWTKVPELVCGSSRGSKIVSKEKVLKYINYCRMCKNKCLALIRLNVLH